MIVNVENKLDHPIVVTFIVMPIPKADTTDGTLYVLISKNRASIEEDKAKLGEDGAVSGEVKLAPGASAHLRGLPDADDIQVGSENGLNDVSTEFALRRTNSIIICKMTVGTKTAAKPS